MGRLLKHRTKDNKWRVWSTGTDSWLTGWLNEDEIKQYLVSRTEYEYRLKIIEIFMTFPDEYGDKDSDFGIFTNETGRKAFSEWQSQAFKNDRYAEVNKKFKELTGEAT